MRPEKVPQSERVTFLTTPEHKAALDAFAASRGESVGNVVREATARYMGQAGDDEEAELAALVEQVNEAIPKMEASLDEMSRTIRATNARVDRTLREAGIRK
jgi:hypothetical protein